MKIIPVEGGHSRQISNFRGRNSAAKFSMPDVSDNHCVSVMRLARSKGLRTYALLCPLRKDFNAPKAKMVVATLVQTDKEHASGNKN